MLNLLQFVLAITQGYIMMLDKLIVRSKSTINEQFLAIIFAFSQPYFSEKKTDIKEISDHLEIKTELNFSTMNLNSLNFRLYLFIGFIIGTIISILIFKNKNKTTTE